MRISEDRYWRDLRRLDLAVRMLHLEARVGTVCTWTGLRPDRVRTLARSLTEPGFLPARKARSGCRAETTARAATRAGPVASSPAADAVFTPWLMPSHSHASFIRHRGQSPRQLAYFSRSVRMRLEAATLASLLVHFGAFSREPVPDAARRFPTPGRGLALCSAYRAYRTLFPGAQITFEYAALLTVGLAQADELALAVCPQCGVLLVIDPLATKCDQCMYCNPAMSAKLGEVYRARTTSPTGVRPSSPAQLALFADDVLEEGSIPNRDASTDAT
jgi:hypothetical protein